MITAFVDVHNHELHSEICKFGTKFRSIKKKALDDIEFYTKNKNLSITQHQLLKAKYPDTVFLYADFANTIQHFKVKSRDLKGDASQLFLYLTDKQSEESVWIANFELDNNNRLIRFFWMMPNQVALWLKYYDVVLNNNTAKTNQYQMPLSLFLIVDNNTRSRLMALALVFDKAVDSYQWILQCTKKATEAELLVFITDADLAIDSAIKRVYENTKSLYCIYYIY